MENEENMTFEELFNNSIKEVKLDKSITKKIIDFKTFFSNIFYILLFSFIFDITILLGYIYKTFINKFS